MNTLKIAIQKSGRLNEDSIQILKDCGISIDNGNDQLKASATNFPLEVLYLRNSDIPQYLIDGVVDIAIVGDNLLVEKGKNIKVIKISKKATQPNIFFQATKFFYLINFLKINWNSYLKVNKIFISL